MPADRSERSERREGHGGRTGRVGEAAEDSGRGAPPQKRRKGGAGGTGHWICHGGRCYDYSVQENSNAYRFVSETVLACGAVRKVEFWAAIFNYQFGNTDFSDYVFSDFSE